MPIPFMSESEKRSIEARLTALERDLSDLTSTVRVIEGFLMANAFALLLLVIVLRFASKR
jgi:hypothetical protein